MALKGPRLTKRNNDHDHDHGVRTINMEISFYRTRGTIHGELAVYSNILFPLLPPPLPLPPPPRGPSTTLSTATARTLGHLYQ